jgi:hypothetical protein
MIYGVFLHSQLLQAFTLEWDDYKIRQLLEKGERDRRYVMRKYGLHDAAMDSKVHKQSLLTQYFRLFDLSSLLVCVAD